MPVISHRPIIILFECVVVGRYIIDEDLLSTDFKFVMFVHTDYPIIKIQIIQP